MKTLLLSIFVLFSYIGSAQANLNDYKYVIVPKQFDGFKKQNQHQTSTLVKYLFTQKGFLVIYDDALPDELSRNRCLGLLATLNDESSMFSTKTAIVLKDCKGDKVFVTKTGKSKSKEYNAAYSEALREAMTSFDGINHAYKEKEEDSKPITVSFKNDVKKLRESNPDLKMSETKSDEEEISEVSDAVKPPKNINPMVKQEATVDEQSYKSLEPVSSEITKADSKEKKEFKMQKPNKEEIWYAQALPNGYQLVDSSPKIRMKLLKSSSDNVYMAQSDDKSGMVYQKEGKWIFEYYEGDQLIQEELNIKF